MARCGQRAPQRDRLPQGGPHPAVFSSSRSFRNQGGTGSKPGMAEPAALSRPFPRLKKILPHLGLSRSTPNPYPGGIIMQKRKSGAYMSPGEQIAGTVFFAVYLLVLPFATD